MKKESLTKFYGVFDHFSRTNEVTKLSDVIHANEQT